MLAQTTLVELEKILKPVFDLKNSKMYETYLKMIIVSYGYTIVQDFLATNRKELQKLTYNDFLEFFEAYNNSYLLALFISSFVEPNIENIEKRLPNSTIEQSCELTYSLQTYLARTTFRNKLSTVNKVKSLKNVFSLQVGDTTDWLRIIAINCFVSPFVTAFKGKNQDITCILNQPEDNQQILRFGQPEFIKKKKKNSSVIVKVPIQKIDPKMITIDPDESTKLNKNVFKTVGFFVAECEYSQQRISVIKVGEEYIKFNKGTDTKIKTWLKKHILMTITSEEQKLKELQAASVK